MKLKELIDDFLSRSLMFVSTEGAIAWALVKVYLLRKREGRP